MPKSRKMRKGMWGGSAINAASVSGAGGPSAWSSVMNTVGDGWRQFTDSLMNNPGQNPVAAASTTLVPIANPNANVSTINDIKINNGSGQMGGRKRGRGRRGGNLGAGAVLGQAVVPLALLGLQHTYAKRTRHRGGKRSRRHSRKH
jgi:hypothetical protein